jgi:hypothetical protein
LFKDYNQTEKTIQVSVESLNENITDNGGVQVNVESLENDNIEMLVPKGK